MGTYWSKGPQPVPERPTHLLLGSSLQGHRMSSLGLGGSSLASGLAVPVSHQRPSLTLGLSSPPCKVERMGQRESLIWGILSPSRNLMTSQDSLPQKCPSSYPLLPRRASPPPRLQSCTISSPAGWVYLADLTDSMYNSRDFIYEPAGTPSYETLKERQSLNSLLVLKFWDDFLWETGKMPSNWEDYKKIHSTVPNSTGDTKCKANSTSTS